MKKCSKCTETKEFSSFRKTKAGNYKAWCNDCFKAYGANYRKRKPEAVAKTQRKSMLKTRYGLTLEAYDAMLKEQGGGCGICGIKGWELCVDHSHVTNKVRGLLCHKCNQGLGLFNDNEMLLKAAAGYLWIHRMRGSG